MTRVRWFVSGAVAAVVVIAGGGFLIETGRQRRESLQHDHERLVREHEELKREAEKLAAERKQLAEIVERLNVERRVAEIDVLSQNADENGRVLQTVIRFSEIGRDNRPLPPQVFGVPGRIPHFDALVIKFGNDFVAKGDPLRGKSLALFRRVYGETQAPDAGYWLGRPGDVPDIFRIAPEPSEFEAQLWREFWTYATDPSRAAAAGVRVAQGEAVYAPMSSGERWHLSLEADGGLNLLKLDGQSAGGAASRPVSTPTTAAAMTRLSAPSPLKDAARAPHQ